MQKTSVLDVIEKEPWLILNREADVMTDEELLRRKIAFIKSNEAIPPAVDAKIAESWMRSKQHGVNPDLKTLKQALKQSELKALQKDKSLFLKIAKTSILDFLPLLNDGANMFALSSDEGVILSFMEEACWFPPESRLHSKPGTIWTEDTVGTFALPFCIKMEKMVQLIGDYHYLNVFSRYLTTAVADIYPRRQDGRRHQFVS